VQRSRVGEVADAEQQCFVLDLLLIERDLVGMLWVPGHHTLYATVSVMSKI